MYLNNIIQRTEEIMKYSQANFKSLLLTEKIHEKFEGKKMEN